MNQTVEKFRAVGRYLVCLLCFGFGVSLLFSDDTTPSRRLGLTDRQTGVALAVVGLALLINTVYTDRKAARR